MGHRPMNLKRLTVAVSLAFVLSASGDLRAQTSDLPATTTANQTASASTDAHPLDPAIKIALEGRERIIRDIKDYSATLIKRERVDDELKDYEFMSIKVRNRKVEGKTTVVPLSVYLRFLKPRSAEGREVIWIEGKNDGKMFVHEGGFRNLLTVRLDPNGTIAMMGQRYSISNIGIENLLSRLIEKGERDRKRDECEVKFFAQAKIDDRACTLIEVRHPNPRPHFDFSLCRSLWTENLVCRFVTPPTTGPTSRVASRCWTRNIHTKI